MLHWLCHFHIYIQHWTFYCKKESTGGTKLTSAQHAPLGTSFAKSHTAPSLGGENKSAGHDMGGGPCKHLPLQLMPMVASAHSLHSRYESRVHVPVVIPNYSASRTLISHCSQTATASQTLSSADSLASVLQHSTACLKLQRCCMMHTTLIKLQYTQTLQLDARGERCNVYKHGATSAKRPWSRRVRTKQPAQETTSDRS